MSNEPMAFQEAVKQYDRATYQEQTDTAEKQRQEAVELFPLDKWPEMPLTRYALGQGNNKESFCWWMEFGTPVVGSMRGGSARKHLIYRQRDGNWYFDKQTYSNENEAWQALRAGFVEAFGKAKDGNWAAIDQIEALSGGAALRTKALHCYFPTEVLPITSSANLRHFLTLLGSEKADLAGVEVVQLNRMLLDKMQHTPGFEGWKTKEIEGFLYRWANPNDQPRIVKIAPGEDAKFWEQCLSGGFICVGWEEVGDLREFESKESFQAKFNEVFHDTYKGNQSQLTKKGKEVWTLRELEAGDLVIANQGVSKILAVGTVVEPTYDYQPGMEVYGHHVHVKWDTSYAQDITAQKNWAFVTVAPVSQALSTQILTKKAASGAVTLPSVPVDRIYKDIADALKRKGQVILYGPPGTGKTFCARRFHVRRSGGSTSAELLAVPIHIPTALNDARLGKIGATAEIVIAAVKAAFRHGISDPAVSCALGVAREAETRE